MTDTAKPGDVLWYAPDNRYSRRDSAPPGHAVEVVKVGRRWLTVKDQGAHFVRRIEIEDWQEDGGDCPSPGCLYASQAEYQDRLTVAAAWSRFRSRVLDQHEAPRGLDLAWIEAALSKLDADEE